MQDARVGAAADDRLVARHRAVTAELVQELGLDLVLVHARPRRAHRAHVRGRGDLCRLAHHAQFAARFVQTQIVQQVRQRDEFVRRHRAFAHVGAHAVDPADQFQIELGIATEMVVDARAAFDHAGQDVVDVVDRKRVVETVIAHRAFGADARAVPALAFGVALAAEQDHLALLAAGYQREHRVGLGKSAEIVKVAVLPVRIVRIVAAHAFRSGGHDHDRVASGHAHQLPAAAHEFPGLDHRKSRRWINAPLNGRYRLPPSAAESIRYATAARRRGRIRALR